MPGGPDRFYVLFLSAVMHHLQANLPRAVPMNFRAKNSGRFCSCRRFHHILQMCAVFTAASFLSLAVSAIIHRVLRTVPCAVLAAVFRTVLTVVF